LPPKNESNPLLSVGRDTVVNWVKDISLPGTEGKSVGALLAVAGSLIAFATDPIGFLRSRLAPIVVGGIIDMVTPFLDGILFLFVGTEVGYPGYPPDGSTYGVTDVVPLVVDIVGGSAASLFRMGVSGLIDINQALIPSGTPIAGLVAYAMLVIEVIVLTELGTRLLRAGLDSVPGASGIETFVFGGE
jgi:hypothetical protein